MRDSYERFFSEGYISKEQFFEFGLKETIYVPLDKAVQEWEGLKYRVFNNEPVCIRSYGRNARNSHLFSDLYVNVLGNDQIKIDATNNSEPSKVIKGLTGYSKQPSRSYELIRNYQISHVFGRTKNALAFTAPWNIVYMPKILDPFTGHEASGPLIDEFKYQFKMNSYNRFKVLIDDYNELVLDKRFVDKIDKYFQGLSSNPQLNESDLNKFKRSIDEEFLPIIAESMVF